jgi:hypothetical protein
MTKIFTTPRIGTKDPDLTRAFKEIATQVNGVTEGRMAAFHTAAESVPTTGEYAQGDFVANSLPEELGAAASRYVIAGWQYVDVGAGVLDWVERRFLTGN